MKPIDADATLVQVIYDMRIGLLAFFSDGSVAEAKETPNGRRTWHVKENLFHETNLNAQDPNENYYNETAP